MNSTVRNMRRLRREESGATAIEYGLICGLLVLGIMTALSGFADENTGVFANVSQKQSDATQGAIN